MFYLFFKLLCEFWYRILPRTLVEKGGENQWIFRGSNSNMYILLPQSTCTAIGPSPSPSHDCLSPSRNYTSHILFFYLDTICPTNWSSVFLLPFWKTGCSYVLSPLFQNMQELVFRLLQAAQVWKHFMRNNCRSVCSVSASRGNVTLSGKRALCRQQLLLCGQHKWYWMSLHF